MQTGMHNFHIICQSLANNLQNCCTYLHNA